jgi:hypothetical protein
MYQRIIFRLPSRIAQHKGKSNISHKTLRYGIFDQILWNFSTGLERNEGFDNETHLDQ